MKLKKIQKLKKSFLTIEKLLLLKGHLGQDKKLVNPKMFSFILGERQNRHIINLEKSLSLFKRALHFLRFNLDEKKSILFIGTPLGQDKKMQALLLSNKLAFFNPNFWIGGLLTNWSDHKFYRESFINSSHIQKSKDLNNFLNIYGGLTFLFERPNVIVIFNTMESQDVIKEAHLLNIPIIAFLDTHDNPEFIDYPIPLNVQSYEMGSFLYQIFYSLLLSSENSKIDPFKYNLIKSSDISFLDLKMKKFKKSKQGSIKANKKKQGFSLFFDLLKKDKIYYEK